MNIKLHPNKFNKKNKTSWGLSPSDGLQYLGLSLGGDRAGSAIAYSQLLVILGGHLVAVGGGR